MEKKIKNIAVFCGSQSGNKDIYSHEARNFANALTAARLTLIYGGANIGLMGELANQILKNGGQVIGVIPQALADIELAHENLTDIYIVNSMHERKAQMVNLADAFVLLPGGPGSLDEFFEIFTWAKLSYHKKPIGILNIDGYYDTLLKFIDEMVSNGFLLPEHRALIHVEKSPTILISQFAKLEVANFVQMT